MPGFVIALLACATANCDLTNLEPGVSFPTYEACQAELTAKAPSFKDQLERAGGTGRSAQTLCVREIATIIDVEEPYDVIDTAIVHSDASASSPFVGIVEAGQKTLVTGVVAGTQWLRVVMADGKSGFVFGDHLRKLGGTPPRVATATPPAAPPPAASPPPLALTCGPRQHPDGTEPGIRSISASAASAKASASASTAARPANRCGQCSKTSAGAHASAPVPTRRHQHSPHRRR